MFLTYKEVAIAVFLLPSVTLYYKTGAVVTVSGIISVAFVRLSVLVPLRLVIATAAVVQQHRASFGTSEVCYIYSPKKHTKHAHSDFIDKFRVHEHVLTITYTLQSVSLPPQLLFLHW